MEKKINLVELLKDCPKGMELDCTMFNNVTFDKVEADLNARFPICIKVGIDDTQHLTKHGDWRYGDINSKCVIFPKGKTTWEGFVPPVAFKDGDIVVTTLGNIAIISEPIREGTFHTYIFQMGCNIFCGNYKPQVTAKRFATEEEKQKLFQAIKENGYRWNAETKMLEKLTPNFEDGDVLFLEGYRNYQYIFIFNKPECHGDWHSYCHLDLEDSKFYSIKTFLAGRAFHPRFATEEEKLQLFDAIKANGYKWNAETKTLEKLNVPKFKVGVRIKKRKDYISGTIINISDDGFYKVEHQNGGVSYVNIAYQDEWELVPVEPKFKVGNRITNGKGSIKIGYIDDNYYYEIGRNIASRILIKEQDEWRLDKFDINTLKPFESRVLVRNIDEEPWKPAIYGFSHPKGYYTVGGGFWKYCIPYETNKELLGTINNIKEYGAE